MSRLAGALAAAADSRQQFSVEGEEEARNCSLRAAAAEERAEGAEGEARGVQEQLAALQASAQGHAIQTAVVGLSYDKCRHLKSKIR